MSDEELKKHFEANMLDGDEIQAGQMISSESAFEYARDLLTDYKKELLSKAETFYVEQTNGVNRYEQAIPLSAIQEDEPET